MKFPSIGAVLSLRKEQLIAAGGIVQHGLVTVPFPDAPPWPDGDGPADDAIIESFLVDGDGLTPLSDSEWLDRWRPRAEAMVSTLQSWLAAEGVHLAGPGYLTCSITPTSLLEGSVHVDDDQHDPDDGVGVVAISGQHLGPRVLTGTAPLTGEVRRGPLPIDESWLDRDGPISGSAPAPGDHLTVFAGFGQIHAGPAAADLGADPPAFRQLMVFRAATQPSDSQASVSQSSS